MMSRRHMFSVLCAALLVLAGCGAQAEPTVLPATVAAPAPSPTAPSAASAATAQTAAEASAINSYRLRIVTASQSPRGLDQVEVDAAFIKEPPAEEWHIRFQDGAQTLAMISVEGVRYMQAGDQWLQTPETTFAVDELTLITPEDVAGLLGRMTLVGVEEVNGVQALHYRGGKEVIPVVGEPGDSLDVSQLAMAELNLWIDQATNVVTRLVLAASDAEGGDAVSLDVVFDYYDFNAPIAIRAPATSAGLGTGDPAAPATALPGDTLSQLLGFRFMLPTGSTVESALGTTMVTALTPFTLAEAQRMLELTLPANGYTLVTRAEPAPGQTVYLFQQADRAVTVTVAAADAGTRMQFVAAP